MRRLQPWSLVLVILLAGCGPFDILHHLQRVVSWPDKALRAVERLAGARGVPPPMPRTVPDPEAAALIRAEDVDGAFVLLDPVRNLLHVSDPIRAEAGYLPASTFKIPNTLIGLETGVIPDERFALRWDGQSRSIDAWNRDHDLASALRFSVVWFYQEVARRIGGARMQRWVAALGYGNRDIGGGLDSFWLDGALRISPREQVSFLHRLARGDLPVQPEHAALVLRLIELERQGDAVLRGKTGMGWQDDQSVGWLVGLVEKGGTTYPYAMLVLAPREHAKRLMSLRHALTRRLLARHGLWQP